MERKNAYRILNIIQTILWFTAIFLGFLGIKNIPNMLALSGYTFIILGVLTYGSYFYFKKAPVL